MNLAKKCDMLQKEVNELRDEVEQLKRLLYDKFHNTEFYRPKTFSTTNSLEPSILDIFDKNRNIFLITLSHDPQFIKIENQTKCINYYLQMIDNVIIATDDDSIKMVGSFELNKNGRVHAHILFQNYSGPSQFNDLIKPCITQRKHLNVAVDCRPVTELNGAYNYIIKSPLLSLVTTKKYILPDMKTVLDII